ncbi:hypothetical protein FDZ73_08345 [bacterium]|nr:MAG: hypothetical protein FDZ73_08345 [bacterium]
MRQIDYRRIVAFYGLSRLVQKKKTPRRVSFFDTPEKSGRERILSHSQVSVLRPEKDKDWIRQDQNGQGS